MSASLSPDPTSAVDDLPSTDALRRALDALEPHATHPATGALHDPLYALLTDRDPDALVALRAALGRHGGHPAAGALHDALGAAVALPPRTLAQILADRGPALDDDSLRDVELRLDRATEREAVLRDRVEQQEQELAGARRTVELLAAVGALLAVATLIGWLGALDAWTIAWVEPAAPPPDIASPEP
ncbi:MAG: hypothetical protein H6742_05000 [Alphaproteobacteria bacterium]|nr:hypothetical protein [Alphaproteobacteria bacterium]